MISRKEANRIIADAEIHHSEYFTYDDDWNLYATDLAPTEVVEALDAVYKYREESIKTGIIYG